MQSPLLNVISRETMIVNNPESFLKFLANGTYEVVLKVQSGKGGQEFFIPKIRDTTQNKVVGIRKVFPVGCTLQEDTYEGKVYSQVVGVSGTSFEETWNAINEHFFQELMRQKERVLRAGEHPTVVGGEAKARILPGAEDKLCEAYGDKFDPATQSICYTLNMVWFREAGKTKEGIAEESKMGLQCILAYPSGGSKPFGQNQKKRKLANVNAEGQELAPGIYPAGTCIEGKEEEIRMDK